MLNFLHTFSPTSVLISFGPVHIYWYGLFIVLGAICGIFVIMDLAPGYGMAKDTALDLILYLMIAGIIGARIYDVLLELGYYRLRPFDVFKVWQGGMAIHGAIIGGILVIWLFAKKQKLNFWITTDVVVAGLAIGQAVGRWGNYFNQELFGLPTNMPWGIPILPLNRPPLYASFDFFQPTFLYESLGNLAIFVVIFYLHNWNLKGKELQADKRQSLWEPGIITAIYLILYSILRFSLEFIRVDSTPTLSGFRFPQIVSLLLIAVALIIFYVIRKQADLKKNKIDVSISNSSHKF